MTHKITLELVPTQVEALVEKLSIPEKIRLIKKLEQETLGARLDRVVNQARKRFKQNPLSDKEIQRICEETRQRIYDERTSGRR